MEVKLVARTLEVFELYAREPRPMSLTDLARGLDAPPSSTLALIRTLVQRGYLYETRRKGGYYPTKKLYAASMRIDAGDPILEYLRPHLAQLRDRTGETAVLGKRLDLSIVYLEVVPCDKSIRYTIDQGDTRPLYPNSMGKAIFASLDPDEQARLAPRIKYTPAGARRPLSQKDLLLDAAETARRGWGINLGETVADLVAVAVPFSIGDEWFSMAFAGPTSRVQASWDRNIAALEKTLRDLKTTLKQQFGS